MIPRAEPWTDPGQGPSPVPLPSDLLSMLRGTPGVTTGQAPGALDLDAEKYRVDPAYSMVSVFDNAKYSPYPSRPGIVVIPDPKTADIPSTGIASGTIAWMVVSGLAVLAIAICACCCCRR